MQKDYIGIATLLFAAGFFFLYKRDTREKTKKLAQTYITNFVLNTVSKRSKYIWTSRPTYRCKFKKHIMDKLFLVDPKLASLNSSTVPSERVAVDSAILIRGNVTEDVTKDMTEILIDFNDSFMGDNGQITIDLEDIVSNPEYDFEGEYWHMDVTYSGHSNVTKKIEAQKYNVRYRAKKNDTILFPPYSISEFPKKGLCSSKIVEAIKENGGDVKYLAKSYSGLRLNFYNDRSEDVVKNHMNVAAKVTVSGKKSTVYHVSSKN